MLKASGKPAIGPSRDGSVLNGFIGPVFFCLYVSFCTFGTFWQCKNNHRVFEGMSSNTTVKESYWKLMIQQAYLSTNEWTDERMSKRGDWRNVFVTSLMLTYCGWRVHEAVLWHWHRVQSISPKETASINQLISQSSANACLYTLQTIQMPCYIVWNEHQCQCVVHLSWFTSDILVVQCEKHLFSTKINLYAQMSLAFYCLMSRL